MIWDNLFYFEVDLGGEQVLLHLGCSYLSVVLQDALSLVRAFEVFTPNTFAVGVARNASLEALTVLFKTLALLAVATFRMAVLAVTDYV